MKYVFGILIIAFALNVFADNIYWRQVEIYINSLTESQYDEDDSNLLRAYQDNRVIVDKIGDYRITFVYLSTNDVERILNENRDVFNSLIKQEILKNYIEGNKLAGDVKTGYDLSRDTIDSIKEVVNNQIFASEEFSFLPLSLIVDSQELQNAVFHESQ